MYSTRIHQLLDEALTPDTLDMIETYLNFVKENHVKLIAPPAHTMYSECDISSPLKFIDAFKVEYPNLNHFQLLYIYMNSFQGRPGNLFYTPDGIAAKHSASYRPIKHWHVFNTTVKYIAPITSPQTAILHEDYVRNHKLQQTVTLYPILFKV